MNSKLALKSALAFALALFAGYVLFNRSGPAAPVAGTDARGNKDAANPAMNVAFAGGERSPQYAPLVSGRPMNLDRNFDAVSGGLKNNNMRMQTTVATRYADGMTYAIKNQKNAFIDWKPVAQEVRIGLDVAAVTGTPSSSQARLENHGGLAQVVYPATYPSTDEYVYVRPDGGIEHDIVLKKQPDLDAKSGLAYSGYIKLSPGLTMWDDKTQITSDYKTRNGVFFKNKLGNTVFYLNTPIAYDANVALPNGGFDKEKQARPHNQKCALTCEYQIKFDDKGINLAIVTPANWLQAPDRMYPVTIDPTFGPFGLADGDPPIYVGAVGTGSLIPAFNGGAKLAIEEQCAGSPPNDDGYGTIQMPFDFTFYGTTFPAGLNFYIHIDGWASWDPPSFNHCDEIPCDPGESPCFDYPQASNGLGAIPNGAYPTDGAIYAMWNDLRFSNDSKSGIYYFVDGIAPSRRLIIEWHKMGYFRDSNPDDVISFNMILYECQGVIEVIIGDVNQGNKYHGTSTIGIESPGDTRAVVYDTYSPPAPMAPATTDLNNLDVTFSTSPLGTVQVTSTNNQGCIPLRTCFAATVDTTVPLCVQLNGGVSIPPTFGFHYQFGDNSDAFSQNVCHTYSSPQRYRPKLTVTDQFGNVATYDFLTNPAFEVLACDLPPVFITATPQGGTAPLSVNVVATSTSPFVPDIPATIPTGSDPPAKTGLVPTISVYDVANTTIQVDQLSPQNEPGVFAPFLTVTGGTPSTIPTQGTPNTTTTLVTSTTTVLFDTPGTYRIQAHFPGTSFTLPTEGVGTIYIDVTDPNSTTSNSFIVTDSAFKIDWAGKINNAKGVPPRPANDTIVVNGFINLTGLDLSMLAGQEITLALNGYDPIFQGTLDAFGHAVQGDFATGKTGDLKISLPSGKFTCSVKGDYAASLALVSENTQTLTMAHYRVQIGNLFNSPGTTVAYGYKSTVDKSGAGTYKFGVFYPTGSFYLHGIIPGAPGGIGKPGAQELLVSGGFIVTAADFKLIGDTVSVTLNGLLARSGGDDLRPSAKSDVIVGIGNYTETLNFSKTPTFKASGKPPAQKFTFKSKGGTNIKSLSWMNRAGAFQIAAFNLPNSVVGINPALAKQPITLTFKVTPDNNQQFIGTTTFDIIKASDTEFKH